MASRWGRAAQKLLRSTAQARHSIAWDNALLNGVPPTPAAVCTVGSRYCVQNLSTRSSEQPVPPTESFNSGDSGRGQWRKWIETKLASKDKKGGPVPNNLSAPASTRVSADVSKAGQMIAETFDSVDDFERRVLGTASSSEDGNDDDDLLKQLDAIDQVSGGSASLSAGYEQDSLLYEGRASWEDDQQPTNLPIDMGFAASESFDIDDVEKPYQMRPGRFFFPGQTYLPEELDISKPEKEREFTSSVRPKKIYENGEILKKADFRNARFLSSFMSETSKISPKRRLQVSAKAQRKVIREIKTARILGLLPFTSVGQAPHSARPRRAGTDADERQ